MLGETRSANAKAVGGMFPSPTTGPEFSSGFLISRGRRASPDTARPVASSRKGSRTWKARDVGPDLQVNESGGTAGGTWCVDGRYWVDVASIDRPRLARLHEELRIVPSLE
jgi:hypothetical protein